jgi:hypothetical protein
MKKPEAKIIRKAKPKRANRYLLTDWRDFGMLFEML